MKEKETGYLHKVQYYETDKMGVTHHSNYIRWMEEARIDCLEKLGWGYDKLESMGVLSPVLSVECKYCQSTTFHDEIGIKVSTKAFNGVRLVLEYEMYRLSDGKLVCEAVSEHAFLDRNFRPVRMKKEFPDFYETMLEQVK